MSGDGRHPVEPSAVLDERRVRGVVVDDRTVALFRTGQRLGALENENRCPHQGGPLGEGSIENEWPRRRWHGSQAAGRTVAGALVETLVARGASHVFEMVGHSNLGFADALRRAEDRGHGCRQPNCSPPRALPSCTTSRTPPCCNDGPIPIARQ